MATFLDRLKSAMWKINALESGETPPTQEQTDGLAIANQMLDAWNADRTLIFSIKRTTHTLTPSLNPHTIGTSGTFVTDRPVKIEKAGLIVAGDDAEYPIEVVFLIGEYARVRDKVTESGIPTLLYYDAAYPNGKIYLTPVPNAANTLVLYRWTPLTAIATVATAVAFPPGYEEAFDYNLAVVLADSNFGQLTPGVEKRAERLLDKIRSVNLQVPIMENSAASLGSGGNRSNIYTGYRGWE